MGQSWEKWKDISEDDYEAASSERLDEDEAKAQIRTWAETLPRRQEPTDAEIAVDAIRSRVARTKV